ncbi:arg8-vasotocin receptor-like [Mytilus edulis]|uniref:arg8-vasotocin receptor-like n=1 Tax=Mytilus edulis TaxID=6550 RepID=UPI0039F0EC56
MTGDNITQIYTNKTIFIDDTANEIKMKKKIFEGIFKWISFSLFCGIVILNTIVIGLLMKRKKKSRMGFFVANLACADLCVGLFHVLPETIHVWFEIDWNEFTCHIFYGYLATFSFYVSTYAIVVLSIDRMNVVVKPLSTVTKLKTYRCGLALSSWILGSLLAIQYVVHVTYYSPKKYLKDACLHEFPYDQELRYFDVCVLLIIPIILIITCYIMIYMAIHRRHTCKFMTTNSNSDGMHERVNFNAKMRTVKQLFVVSVVYVICWTPLFSASLLCYYNVLKFGITYRVLVGLAPLNSLTNPVVFLLFNHNIFCKCRKSSNKNTIVLKTNSSSTNVKIVNAT